MASQDMTVGSPRRLMTRFALPILISFAFQQLYSVTDGFVVGRLVGVEAFAALGATGFYSWMVLSIVIGFTQGFGVLFAKCFGAKDEAGIQRAVTSSAWLCAGIGVSLTALGMLLAPQVLQAVNTPVELMEGALTYLYWILGGTSIAAFYNLLASILRSFGNSMAPLIAVVIAGVINVILDFMFVALFHLGIAGVAIATVIAQAFSFLYCLWALHGERDRFLPRGKHWPDRATTAELLRLGVPIAFRDGVISVGGLFVQNAINQYGTLFVAGVTAAKRYYGVMEIISAALEGAVATFVGQNAGLGSLSRIKEGMRFARRAGLIASAAVSLLVILFARPLIGVFASVPDPSQQAFVLDTGQSALTAMAVCMPALYMLCMHRAAVQGMGNAFIPMLSGFVELILRIACVISAAYGLGVSAIYFSDGFGWIGAMALVCVAYVRQCGRYDCNMVTKRKTNCENHLQ